MLLHWIIAATILLQIALGWFMASQTDRAVKKQFEAIHISLGLTVLILTVARIVWTLTYPRPTMPSGLKRWEKVLSHTVNGLFYVLMLALFSVAVFLVVDLLVLALEPRAMLR